MYNSCDRQRKAVTPLTNVPILTPLTREYRLCRVRPAVVVVVRKSKIPIGRFSADENAQNRRPLVHQNDLRLCDERVPLKKGGSPSEYRSLGEQMPNSRYRLSSLNNFTVAIPTWDGNGLDFSGSQPFYI